MKSNANPGIASDPIVILSWPSTTPLETTSEKFVTALKQPFNFANVQRARLRLTVSARTSDSKVEAEVKLLLDAHDVVRLSTNSETFEILTSDAVDFPKLATTSFIEIQYRTTKDGYAASIEGAVVQLEL